MTLFKHEWKMNYKTFLIWAIVVGAFCGGCLFLFPVMGDSMDGMEEAFASMGAFTQAFGLDRLSITTPEGFFATEVGTIYALGGGMFAALLGIGLLSKEEGGHTADFLYTLPVSRTSVFFQKYATLISILLAFGIFNFAVFVGSLAIIGETISTESLITYMLLQFLLQLEIATICYLISALTKRVQMGMGLGLALALYMLDIMSRIAKETEALKYCTPFSFSNASDLFVEDARIAWELVGISLVITVICLVAARLLFQKKDLAT